MIVKIEDRELRIEDSAILNPLSSIVKLREGGLIG